MLTLQHTCNIIKKRPTVGAVDQIETQIKSLAQL